MKFSACAKIQAFRVIFYKKNYLSLNILLIFLRSRVVFEVNLDRNAVFRIKLKINNLYISSYVFADGKKIKMSVWDTAGRIIF
jgi:hypothetical protein